MARRTLSPPPFGWAPVVGLAAVPLLIGAMFLAGPRVNERLTDPVADAQAACSVLAGQVDPAAAAVPDSVAASPRWCRDVFGSDGAAPCPVDPTLPAPEASTAPATVRPLTLTGILIDGASRQALVGGRLVSEGDEVAGWRVVTISPTAVVLTRGGVQHRLSLQETP